MTATWQDGKPITSTVEYAEAMEVATTALIRIGVLRQCRDAIARQAETTLSPGKPFFDREVSDYDRRIAALRDLLAGYEARVLR